MTYLQLFILGFLLIFYLSNFDIPISMPKLNIISNLQKQNIAPGVTPQIKFLTKNETKEFIENDKDKFIKNLDEVNKRARKVTTSEEYIHIASKAATDFTSDEKDKLTKAIEIACDKLDDLNKRTLKKYGLVKEDLWNMLENWTLAKTKDSVLEMGMPHTREDVIFVSGFYLAKNDQDIDKLVKTMIHEVIHIYQRKYNDQYTDFLKDHEWVVHPYNGNDKRMNPDLDQVVWKRPAEKGEEATKGTRLEAGGYRIFIALFNSRYPKNLKDIDIKQAKYEHPNEYYAYKLSEELTK
jgi:hypothetical protein